MDQSTRIVLLDNGSLRPEAVFSLRRLAKRLGERLGLPVYPVSLLHSSKIPAADLDGVAAETWRRFLRKEIGAGASCFVVLPLFFGPSSAIMDYLPEATGKILNELKCPAELLIANPLVDAEGDDRAVAEIMAKLVLRKLDTSAFASAPAVIMVDHGSPVRAVAEARDLVARQLEEILGDRVSRVIAASMERRDGAEYDFNEPLLERALERIHVDGVESAILSLMFFSPGRHAGPGGDIEQIVAESNWGKSGKALPMCELVSQSEGLIDLLARRYADLVE